jgi:hypothetical protein
MASAISEYDAASTSTQPDRIGAGQYDALGGRIFHLAEIGGTGIDRGKLIVGATHANLVNLSFQTAPTAGDRDIKVTLSSQALSLDDLKDGWLVVQDGTGEGRAYPIEGHAAASASATATITLKETIDTTGALSEANVDLQKNLYKDVVISVTDQADVPVGVSLVAATANQYNWVQTWGAAAVWQDEANAVGTQVTIGTGVAGQVEAQDAAGEQVVGFQGAQAGVATEYQLVYLRLDPLPYNSG